MSETTLPQCILCKCEYTYEEQEMYICPECAHEWPKNETTLAKEEDVIKDANGAILNDGDTVIIIKDLKIKGSSSALKVGTKIKNIRLVGGDHDIDCKVPGIGSMGLKSQFVKKA